MIYSFIDLARLTGDPETKSLGGRDACTFSVATNTSRKDAGGNTIANFINVTVFGARAETCAKYLHKGDPVSLVGELIFREYQSKNKETRVSHDMTATQVTFLPNPKRDADNDSGADRKEKKKAKPTRAREEYEEEEDEDELPF